MNLSAANSVRIRRVFAGLAQAAPAAHGEVSHQSLASIESSRAVSVVEVSLRLAWSSIDDVTLSRLPDALTFLSVRIGYAVMCSGAVVAEEEAA